MEPFISEETVADKKNVLKEYKQEIGVWMIGLMATGAICFIFQKPILVFVDILLCGILSLCYIYLCVKMFFTGNKDETEEEDLEKKTSSCFSVFLTFAAWFGFSFPLNMEVVTKVILFGLTGGLLLSTLILAWIKSIQNSKLSLKKD